MMREAVVNAQDRLDLEELTRDLPTQRIGRRVYAYETIDSTMEVAHRLAQSGEPEGSVVVAEGQSRGRGRLGRRWLSPRSKGIYASVILRPPLKLSEVPRITLTEAVAGARAIQAEAGLNLEIKWPNDLLIRGKKVAGILTELNARLNRVRYIVVGIGINVNSTQGELPPRATSLAEELGRWVDRVKLARTLLIQLDQVYGQFLSEGFGPIVEAWRGFAHFLGRRIRVAAQGRAVEGQAVDLDSDGALVVRTDTGLMESLSSGEVLVVR